MNWDNLKQLKCPKCGCTLEEYEEEYKCIYRDFKIRKGRLYDIVGEFPEDLVEQADVLLKNIQKKDKRLFKKGFLSI